MSSSAIIKNVILKYNANELILASEVFKNKLVGKMTEAAYYKALERMCKAGELVKIAKGTYHLPKIGKYGLIPPSEKEIIESFTENCKGTVIGYSLYNSLKLTTQISKTINILTANIESEIKTIRNIIIHHAQMSYTEDVKNMIHSMEVLQNFSKIQDLNYNYFLEYTKQIAENFSEKAFEQVVENKNYKKSTIAFLQEILNFHGTENKLNMYLSSLSEYKHPKMEELYEIARVSK